MALRPLTEDEKADIEMGRMLRRVAADPKTRPDLYSTLKKADPNLRWPDQDMEDFKREWKEEQEIKEIERQAKASKDKMVAEREILVKHVGEATTKKIEALMEEHGIFSYRAGAKLYAAENPPQPQGANYPDSNRWSMPSDKDLLADPQKWANEQAHKVIAEFRRNRLPR